MNLRKDFDVVVFDVDGVLLLNTTSGYVRNEWLFDFNARLRQSRIATYTATNLDTAAAEKLSHSLDFQGAFDGIFTPQITGFSKPDIRFFKFIDEILNLDSTRILFIDNKPENADAPEELGWQGYTFISNEKLMEDFDLGE